MKTHLKLASALLALGATTASLDLITPAHAQTTSVTRISTTNIDLSSSRGKRILDLRIAPAADTLCYDANEHLDISVRKTTKSCRAEVVRAAQTAVNTKAAAKIASR